MSSRFQAPAAPSTSCPEWGAARAVYAAAAEIFDRAGYGRIETPRSKTRICSRGVGQSTDIVQKEMFSFEDQGGRNLTLRPEGTAPIVRAYLEHGMQKLAQPVKLGTGARTFATSDLNRAAFGSSTRSAPRRSARTRRWSTPS